MGHCRSRHFPTEILTLWFAGTSTSFGCRCCVDWWCAVVPYKHRDWKSEVWGYPEGALRLLYDLEEFQQREGIDQDLYSLLPKDTPGHCPGSVRMTVLWAHQPPVFERDDSIWNEEEETRGILIRDRVRSCCEQLWPLFEDSNSVRCRLR